MDIKLAGIVLGVLLLPFNLFSQTFAEDLFEIAQDEQLMGMSVVRICDEQIDEIFHYGLKDNTRELAIDDSTVFRIASISKTITATGAMLLVDNGSLDLDADISDYLGFECRNLVTRTRTGRNVSQKCQYPSRWIRPASTTFSRRGGIQARSGGSE